MKYMEKLFITYIVQSIVSWIGHIVALLCITVDTWSHEMVANTLVKHSGQLSKRTVNKPWAAVLCLSGTNVLHRGGGGG
jgi:hypothetical protein